MSSSKLVLFFVIVTVTVHHLQGDDDNCKLEKDNKERCLNKLKSGLPCVKDSEVEECFMKCSKKESYYKKQAEQMGILRKAICAKKLEKEVTEKNKCIVGMFSNCHNVYDTKWSDKGLCGNALKHMYQCEEAVEMSKSSEDCKEFMKIVHQEIAKDCVQDVARALRCIYGLILAGVLLTYLFYNCF